ncbi:MAG: type II toxin-antitoxin system RelE/ParE family toxin [Rivularia sp. T60_A2020_040]|nr:type II toxin-antitoxin system RelE/ParE family toxin [Rivularia sp. T60_A2020_040]
MFDLSLIVADFPSFDLGINDTYRVVYAVKIEENVYVLHAFQKKSKQGLKTPQADIDLVKQRYKDALEKEQKA